MAAILKPGDFGGRLDAMERRVQILEDDMREVKTDLKAVLIDTAEIKGTLKGMPTAAAFAELKGAVGELKGRVDALPTMAKMNSAIGLATAVIVVLNNWSLLKTWLVG